MTEPAHREWEIRRILPASLQAIEELCIELRKQAPAYQDPSACFVVELLTREALTNAVEHGCHADPQKHIRCCLRLNRRRLLIAVEDDGDGFDWRAARRHLATFAESSGRGIEIFRKYANRVRYNNEGNVVAMIRRFS